VGRTDAACPAAFHTCSDLPLPGILAAGRAWQNKFIFSYTPLLDRQREQAAAGLIDVLASVTHGEWVIPTVNTQGEACRALVGALADRRLPWSFLTAF
jgi:hypothetical protein